jgi:hypothetical protein
MGMRAEEAHEQVDVEGFAPLQEETAKFVAKLTADPG